MLPAGVDCSARRVVAIVLFDQSLLQLGQGSWAYGDRLRFRQQLCSASTDSNQQAADMLDGTIEACRGAGCKDSGHIKRNSSAILGMREAFLAAEDGRMEDDGISTCRVLRVYKCLQEYRLRQSLKCQAMVAALSVTHRSGGLSPRYPLSLAATSDAAKRWDHFES